MASWGLGEFITAALVLGTPLLWIAWDVYAYIRWGNPATESANIWRWSYRLPGIAFLVGVLCGHLFFQMHEPTEFPTSMKTALSFPNDLSLVCNHACITQCKGNDCTTTCAPKDEGETQ